MKKRGFTLAEVMVALALIGVIASLTIPTFISSSRNRANAAKLATTVSAIENAFSSMIATEAVQDLTETRFGRAQTSTNLGRYLKLSGEIESISAYYLVENPFKTLNNTAIDNLDITTIFQLKNGAILMYSNDNTTQGDDVIQNLGGSVSGKIGDIAIDVNGNTRPNIWGRDVFYFMIGTDGILYPAGSLNFSIVTYGNDTDVWSNNGEITSCTNEDKSLGCTARLIENNYKIDF